MIFSPDNDGNGEYDENLNCIWIIVSPENTAIRLDFNDTIDIEDDPDGECAYDYLQVRRFKKASFAMWVGNYVNNETFGCDYKET